MARLVLAAIAGVVVGCTAGAALDISAREPTEEVVALALEASVDPYELEAAAATVGVTPRQYAYGTGLLAPPVPLTTVWDRLAGCESTGRWNVNTGNSYFGGLQMDMTFWRRHGGLAFAPRPDLATREQQISVAQRGQTVQGWQAWPACSRRLGLR
jgi:hypothetical protein